MDACWLTAPALPVELCPHQRTITLNMYKTMHFRVLQNQHYHELALVWTEPYELHYIAVVNLVDSIEYMPAITWASSRHIRLAVYTHADYLHIDCVSVHP